MAVERRHHSDYMKTVWIPGTVQACYARGRAGRGVGYVDVRLDFVEGYSTKNEVTRMQWGGADIQFLSVLDQIASAAL